MCHRRLSALALVATGALAITAMSVAPSFAADTDSTEAAAPGATAADGTSTVIVQLAPGVVGDDRAGAYRDVKQRIARSVSQVSPGSTIGDVRDYHHALDGFAITAPASALGAIKSVQGVKDAFFDGQREPVFYPEMWGDGGVAVADPAKETRSDQVAGRGRGRVIEVIDASFDTSHEAFAGTMDTAALRLPQAEMESLTSQLDAGQGGAWVSDKIPFVYDYADRDTNPSIGYGMVRKTLPCTLMALAWRRSRQPTERPIRGVRPMRSSSSPRSSLIALGPCVTVTCWRPSMMRWS